MRIYVDVYDPVGNSLGDGPVISLLSADVNRALDGAGSFNLRAPATDARAIELLKNENRIEIWAEDIAGLRLLGEGIIRNVAITVSPSGAALRVSGPDILDELKRKNTLLALIFNQVTISSMASSLIGLVSGWSVSVDAAIASNLVDGRYDGVSVLAAFQDLAKRYGYHIRISNTTARTLEIGPFGDDNGLTIPNVVVTTSELLANPKIVPVQRLQTSDDTADVFNWIIPIGAGEGTAAITLEKSTRTTPYTIYNMAGPDGTTLYYIKDTTSITTYGQIEKVAQFKDIAPLSNDETDQANAANALYDASVEQLIRYKDAKKTYTLTVKNVKQSIRAGDKLTMDYVAQINDNGTIIDYLNITGSFWILKAREAIGLEASYVDLEISNVDRRTQSNAQMVMDSINSIELRNLKPGITSSTRSYVYGREIASTFDCNVPVEFTDATMTVQRVRLRLKTTPFRATSTGAASGGAATQTSASDGDHRHLMFANETDVAVPGDQGYVCAADSGGVGANHVAFRGPNLPLWTNASSGTHNHDVSVPNHTHSPVFGIVDDTQTPINVTVFVNGVDKTLALFGSSTLAPSGGSINVVADSDVLTGLINNAVGGLVQVHDIDVKCASGQGRAEVTIEVFEVTQAISV